MRAKQARSHTRRPGAAKSKSSRPTATRSRYTRFSRHTSLWPMTSSAGSACRGDRIGHLGAPRRPGRRDVAGADVVEAAQQRGGRRQRHVGLRPRRVGRDGDVAGDEPEPLAPVGVDADRQAGALEAGAAQEPQEIVDRRRVRVRRAQHVRRPRGSRPRRWPRHPAAPRRRPRSMRLRTTGGGDVRGEAVEQPLEAELERVEGVAHQCTGASRPGGRPGRRPARRRGGATPGSATPTSPDHLVEQRRAGVPPVVVADAGGLLGGAGVRHGLRRAADEAGEGVGRAGDLGRRQAEAVEDAQQRLVAVELVRSEDGPAAGDLQDPRVAQVEAPTCARADASAAARQPSSSGAGDTSSP